MRKKLLISVKYIFFIALAIFFVWLSLRHLNAEKWEELKAALSRANYLLLLPVVILLVLSHWIRALRWRMLIEPMGYTPSRMNAFLGVLIGYFVNLGAPRLGEVLKCTILARYEKIPANKLIGTIVAERAFDIICLVLLFAITIITQFDVIGAFVGAKIYPFFLNKAGHFSLNKIIILLAAIVVFLLILRYLLARFAHIDYVLRIKLLIAGIWHGLTSVRYVKNKWMFLFQTVLIWLLYLLSTWLGFFALEQTRHLSLASAAVVLAMGSVGMIVSPGGIGAYPLMVQQTISLYGIAEEPYGQALGWLLWFGQFFTFIICGVFGFILLPIINKKKANEEPRNNTTENLPVT